ncbi:MAG: cell shape determination protein CcmA [Gloeobacteraceae cyanobacterium ES-bin-316]|nr:cell shape determination protein CcmA [Ferruginibacter sp.]
MKKIKISLSFSLALLLAISLFISCRKEVSSVIEASSNPLADSVSPSRAAGNNVLTLTGSGLGDIISVVFENGNIPASFNPVFNTDKAMLFRVPDTANGGPQNIIFTNRLGKQFTVPFSVIALPIVNSTSNYNFKENTEITLTGNNLGDVNKVVLTANPALQATIVSKSKKELVIRMPATTLFRSTLDITNLTGTITTSLEFVSLVNNFNFFTEGFDNGEQDASWGDGGVVSSTEAKSGTLSFSKNFQAGNWHQMGFGWNNVVNDGYTYLSFYMKGGSVDFELWIFTQQSPGSSDPFGNANQKIIVPAKVWTYFKIPVNTLNLWANGPGFNQIGWRIKGPGGGQVGTGDERLYLDDVMLVK